MLKKKQESTKISELENKITELTAGWQRTQADFLNFKRQAETERLKLLKSASADLMMEILPVLDNFSLAAKHIPPELENNNWAIGIKQIERQLEDILSNNGLKKIETIGKHFDHNFHEGIEHIVSGRPADEIVEEILPGYTLNETVIRPAKVKVSSGSDK